MNEWERDRRKAERYKQMYPKGTRIELLRLFKVRYGEGKLMPVQVQMNYNAAHF